MADCVLSSISNVLVKKTAISIFDEIDYQSIRENIVKSYKLNKIVITK